MDSGGDLTIRIKGVNDSKKAFDAVIDSAQKLGPELDKATAGAKRLKPAAEQAVKAIDPLSDELDEAGKSAANSAKALDQSSKSMGDYGKAADKAKAGIALLGGAFVMYANQQRDHEVTVMGLRRVYGEATDDYIKLADTIQNTTIFSNDEALQAASVFGTLRAEYGLTDESIQRLITRSADLASVKGFTLVDAAQRVAAAIRGETEGAEALGLALNQNSIDADGLTLSMTNAEAATFRMTAFMDQSAYSMGAAGEVAATSSGQIQKLANRTQDAATAFVDFTGPVGDVAAALTSFGLEAGLALGGLVKLGGGIRSFRAAAGGAGLFSSLATVIGSSGATVGLAGAITAAGAAALIASPAVLALGGAVAYLAIEQGKLMGETDDQTTALTRWASQMGKGGEALNDLIFFAQDFRDLTTEINLMDPWGALTDNGQIKTTVTTLNTLFDELMSLSPESIRQVESALNGMGYSLSNLDQWANDSTAMSEIAQIIYNAWASQIDQGIALATTVDKVTYAWADFEQAQNQAAISSIVNLEAIEAETAALEAQQRAMDRMRANLWDGGTPDDQPTTGLAVDPLARRMAMMPQAAAAITAQLDDMHHAYVSSVASQVVAFVDGMDAAGQKFYSGFVESVEQGARRVGQSLEDIEAARAEWQTLADDVYASLADMNPNSVLGGTMSGIIGTAQGFGSLSQSVADWSGSLAHAAEGQAADQTKLNDLYQRGKISLSTYNEALDANHRIQQANVSVQEDALRIQAKQLPLMAQLAEEQAAYVDSLADKSAEEQLVALSYMDSATSAQALQLANLAAASSTDAMQESTGKMMLAMAEADPKIKAILIDMGLLSEENGELKVNFGDVDAGKRAMDELTTAVMGFALIVSEAFGIEINLNDNNSIARLLEMEATLARLDGRSVTTYVNTVGLNSGAIALHGGVIGHYANGGVVAEMGEAGPELFKVPNGNWSVAPTHSYYNVPPGTSVLPAPATREILDRARGGGGPITNYNGPVQQTITYDDSSFAVRRSAVRSGRRR
jgi:hypothetical protein